MAASPPNNLSGLFKTRRATVWTAERVRQLGRDEVLQLQANAVRLAEPELAALCADVLKESPARGRASSGAAARRKPSVQLVARRSAFEARGVWLHDPRTSWSGVRKSDGTVVFALWARSIKADGGGCNCLLWSPNEDGQRPWSDSPAGVERLAHCKAALALGSAEGFLVQGEPLEGYLPEDKARTILGVDPQTIISFHVEKRGAEYWAAWGKSAPRLS